MLIKLFLFMALAFAKTESRKMYSIVPDQTIEIDGKFKITHRGYGHKILEEGGDLAYFSLEIEEIITNSNKMPNRLDSRIWLPMDHEELINWKHYVIHVTECKAHGPPHDRTVPAKFYVEDPTTKSKQ